MLRQPGYLKRPVAFRPCLATGMALSIYHINDLVLNEKNNTATPWLSRSPLMDFLW